MILSDSGNYKDRLEKLRSERESQSTKATVAEQAVKSEKPTAIRKAPQYDEIAQDLLTDQGRAHLAKIFQQLNYAQEHRSEMVASLDRLARSTSPVEVKEAAEIAERLGYFDQEFDIRARELYQKALKLSNDERYSDLRSLIHDRLDIREAETDGPTNDDAAARMASENFKEAAEIYLRNGALQKAAAALTLALNSFAAGPTPWKALSLEPVFSRLREQNPNAAVLDNFRKLCRKFLLDEDGRVRRDPAPEESAYREMLASTERPAPASDKTGLFPAGEPTHDHAVELIRFGQRPLGDCRRSAALFLVPESSNTEVFYGLAKDLESTGDFRVAARLRLYSPNEALSRAYQSAARAQKAVQL